MRPGEAKRTAQLAAAKGVGRSGDFPQWLMEFFLRKETNFALGPGAYLESEATSARAVKPVR